MKSSTTLLACFAALAHASPCQPTPVSALATPGSSESPLSATLPLTGGGSELPPPATNMTLLKIALAHGIQNYSCASNNGSAAQRGALAVLYDATPVLPGTPGTGISLHAFDNLSTAVLWSQNIPLNLVNASAADPGTTTHPNALPESAYVADAAAPFPAALEGLSLGGPTLKVLGHHFFDAGATPNFDLFAAGLYARVAKAASVNAPVGADAGILTTGAVAWLRLNDTGGSKGVSAVFRVNTAGGVAELCNKTGAGAGSVPYSAFYWFFG